LASDVQAALSDHRTMVAQLAAEEGGRIFKAAGDGYWLEFPSVTGAAKSGDSDARSARFDTVKQGP